MEEGLKLGFLRTWRLSSFVVFGDWRFDSAD
jgi:hypothetical protein